MIGTWEDKTTLGFTNDTLFDDSISRQGVVSINPTGNRMVDGVLSGLAWKGGSITYAFPDNKKDYDYGGEPKTFGTVSNKIEAAARFILDKDYGSHANDGFSVEGFTNLKVAKGGDASATLRYGESSAANPTAYAYYPSAKDRGGDIWFGTSHDYSNAEVGTYNFATVIHETGHALGLKHGHETGGGFQSLPTANDSLEYSVMTYRSYAGDDLTGYDNEPWSYPQTYMMADIAGLQRMYGANYNVNDGNTTYQWKPDSGNTWVNGKVAIDANANRIFATIWDGGGNHDTYNLAAYSNDVSIDLRPGGYSRFRGAQLADLDQFTTNPDHIASGNIYNALLFKGSTKSLIEDAIGGSGDDTIWGNQGKNELQGKAGGDKFFGGAANDIYIGGGGTDLFFFRTGWDRDTIKDFGAGDQINLADFGLADIDAVLALATNSGNDVVITFSASDTLTIKNVHKADLDVSDFVL